HPGAPNAGDDLEDLADLLARLELERVRPTRMMRRVTDVVPGRHVLQLDDHAVDLVWQLVASRLYRGEVLEDPVDVLRGGVQRVHRETPTGQGGEQLLLGPDSLSPR